MVFILIVIFLIGALLTYFVRSLALRNKIMDVPNERSSHTVPTPRGGGVAIAILWYLGLVFFYFENKIDESLFFALGSGIILSIVSFIDDMKNLSPKIRIAAHLVSAIFALYALGGARIIDLGFVQFENVYIISFLAIPFIIWFINLFNFLDGIDGYLGMEGVFVFLSLYVFTGNELLLVLVAVILGFLIWNWPLPKAKIFCGDVGSTLIGFNVAVFAIYFQNTNQISLFIPLILSSLFWFDATLTLFRRWKNREKLSEAHRKHSYQRMVRSGFSHAKTVYFAVGINLLLFLLAFLAFKWSSYIYLFSLFTVITLWAFVRKVDKRTVIK